MPSYKVVPENPNPSGACLCHDRYPSREEGPFAVFYGSELDDPANPHAVLCSGCAKSSADEIRKNPHSSVIIEAIRNKPTNAPKHTTPPEEDVIDAEVVEDEPHYDL